MSENNVRMSIDGKLPVPIVINDKPMSNITMTSLTIEESLKAINLAKVGQYTRVSELVQMIQWRGVQGAAPITYEQLMGSAKQNLAYLDGLEVMLQQKEREAAESVPAA